MKVNQIYELMNGVTGEILGKTDLVKEDLSNVVDVGAEIFGVSDVDNYVKSLVNHIGKVIFVDRPYSGNIPSVLMDSWEFGSVLEKISADIPEATENESWNLVDKQEYKQDIFYQPKVSAKFFNKKVTFEVPMSFTELQVKQSFSSAAQLNGFISMIYNAVDKSMTVKIDSLVMRTINNMIAETFHAEFPSIENYKTNSGIKAVNLLKLYNDKMGTTAKVKDRLSKISTLFNIGKKERFTSGEFLHIVLLSEFKSASGVYLSSDTFHENYVALPESESVPYWQASGQNYDFENTSKINVKTASGEDIEVGGILGIMFDRDSLGVCNSDRRVTTNYNAKAEFFNNYYKFDASYFNDLNENFVVFYIAEGEAV